MEDRFEDLRAHIASMERAIVCYSGGLDSTALMHICKDVLGENVIAVYISVAMESRHTLSAIQSISQHLDFPVSRLFMDDRIASLVMHNGEDRCYLCKKAIYSEVLDLAHSMGIGHVLTGDNADDDPETRPGMMAAKELGIESPFRRFGIGRRDVESYIENLALPFPMVKETCLLTRIPIGTEANEELLERIERIESSIRSLTGVRLIRARLSEGTIRMQTVDGSIDELLAHESELVELCRSEGFGAEIVRTGYKG